MYNVMRGSKLENNMDSKNKIIIFGHKDSNKNYSFCGNYKFCIQERSYQWILYTVELFLKYLYNITECYLWSSILFFLHLLSWAELSSVYQTVPR